MSRSFTHDQMQGALAVMEAEPAPSWAKTIALPDENLWIVWWLPETKADEDPYALCLHAYDGDPSHEDEPRITGSVKWDGCCNLKGCTPHYGFHYCDPGDMGRWFSALDREMYRLAAENLPTWDLGPLS